MVTKMNIAYFLKAMGHKISENPLYLTTAEVIKVFHLFVHS